MRKYTEILSIVILAAVCLCSCIGGNSPEEFTKLNGLAQKLTSNYTLEIKVETATHTVTDKYTVTETDIGLKVDCRTERINKFVVDGDSITAPDEYMTVTERTLPQDEVEMGLFDVPRFNFSADCLDYSSVTSSGLEMQCTLRLPEKFMGRTVNGDNILLTVTYTESEIHTVSLSYFGNESEEVTITYIFSDYR